MSRLANIALASCLGLGIAATAQAQAQESQRRPLRIGNINVMVFGIGWPTFDHPAEFSDAVFPNVSYQRRIARREMRHLPIWVRGAVNFLSDDREFFGYTIWRESDGTPFTENVQEHTSDFTVRGEMLADFLHGAHWAVYGGAGFGLHALNFSTNGSVSAIETVKEKQNELAPSAAAGARLFSVKRSYTGYAEFRYLKVYGKTNATAPGQPYLTESLFEFVNVDAWSFETGLGFHW